MRTRTSWLAGLLLVLLCTPSTVRAQAPHFGPPSFDMPLPVMWGDRDEGPYVAAEAIFMRLNVAYHNQALVFRGLVDEAGQLDGSTNPDNVLINGVFQFPGIPGSFLGSGRTALTARENVDDRFEPGGRFTVGYRFRNGVAVEVVYWKVAEFVHTAGASLYPGGSVGTDFADSFLFSPFFNFSPFFAGPDRDVLSNVRPFAGQPLPAFGIFNGYEDASLKFTQLISSTELNVRLPVCEGDCTRTYSLLGLRYIHLTEIFKLRMSDADIDGFIAPENVAVYENKWENRLYGFQAGMGNEAYLGNGFALSIDARVGIFADVEKTGVKLIRQDDPRDVGTQSHRNELGASPMFQLGAYLWWYPFEGCQVRAGYEFLGLFNVLRARDPVAFNVGELNPTYSSPFLRADGVNIGIAFIF
jgi:putative beta barrel porin BBP7